MAGLRAGAVAEIRDDAGRAVLTYRSFASVVGIVAALIAGIVLVAGVAAVLFLLAEGRPAPAIAALALSVGFAVLILLLVPRTNVTLYEGTEPALLIRQVSGAIFPQVTYEVTTPDGTTLALLRKNFFSRLGRNRWSILDAANGRHTAGVAIEETLGRALRRKMLAKFNRRHDANVLVRYRGAHAATIYRRPDPRGQVDVLELMDNAFDPRVAFALALLILGSEP